jgi:hypothetical protein
VSPAGSRSSRESSRQSSPLSGSASSPTGAQAQAQGQAHFNLDRSPIVYATPAEAELARQEDRNREAQRQLERRMVCRQANEFAQAAALQEVAKAKAAARDRQAAALRVEREAAAARRKAELGAAVAARKVAEAAHRAGWAKECRTFQPMPRRSLADAVLPLWYRDGYREQQGGGEQSKQGGAVRTRTDWTVLAADKSWAMEAGRWHDHSRDHCVPVPTAAAAAAAAHGCGPPQPVFPAHQAPLQALLDRQRERRVKVQKLTGGVGVAGRF